MTTMTRPPAQPWPTPMPYPQTAPPPPKRARWIIPTAAGLALLTISTAAIIGFAAGRSTAPMTASPPTTTTVTANPAPQEFTAADAAWCTEYKATSQRLADAGRAADAPRSMAAPDLPAAAWTPEESEANTRLADQLASWTPGLANLRSGVSNPTLELLIIGSNNASSALADKIHTGAYVPSDFSLYRAVTATDTALLAICDRIQ